MKMNSHAAAAVVNIGIIALVGFGIYITNSLLCLLGLFFMTSSKSDSDSE